MKTFLGFLGGILSTLLAAGVCLAFLSNNKIAIQFGGEGNTIEQNGQDPSGPQTSPPTQPVVQPQVPGTATPAPVTQPPPTPTSHYVPSGEHAHAPQPTPIAQVRRHRSPPVRDVEECEYPEEEVVDEIEIVIEECDDCEDDDDPPQLSLLQ